jgi:hypothetical protein
MKISVRTATIALVLAASAAGVALAQSSSPAASSGAPADSSANPSASAQAAQGPAASSQPPAGPVVQHVTNGPVPDTPASRAANGGPMSNGGQATKPAGN